LPSHRQPGRANRVVDDEQLVQIDLPLGGEQVNDPVEGCVARRLTRRCHALDHPDDARTNHPSGNEMLARQSEQEGRRVMLHGPSQQELIQLLVLQRTRLTPPEITRHGPQVVCAGLVTLPVGAKLTYRDLQAF